MNGEPAPAATSQRRREAATGELRATGTVQFDWGRETMMWTRSAVPAGVALATLLSLTSARAADIQFSLTNSERVEIRCNGPYFRISPCANLQPSSRPHNFYSADDNFLDPYGMWHCQVNKKVPREFCSVAQKGYIEFCAYTSTVALTWDGKQLTVNQNPKCRAAMAASVLGQNGEGDASPAQDLDSYSFAGQPGEQVEIRLNRDGSGGSAGDIATLEVRAASGAVLGQRTGAVPLKLAATLPGPVEVAVSRQPGGGDPLRGHYTLEVIPQSGDIGERKLTPSPNVEH